MKKQSKAKKDTTAALSPATLKLLSYGLSLEQALELGIEYIADASSLDKQFAPIPSLKLVYRDSDGSDTGFYRLRYLQHPPGFGAQLAKPQRYVQLAKTLNWVYLPHVGGVDWDAVRQNSSIPLLITEGELKAACAQVHGWNTIALGGVTMWLSAKKGVSLLPPLDQFNWKGRNVTIIFDSDAADNPQVALASTRLAKCLVLQGAQVRVASLPAALDGSKQGLDDYLVAGNTDLQDLIDNARPLELGEQLAVMNNRYSFVADQDVVIDLDTAVRLKRDSFVNGKHANLKVVELLQLANGGSKRLELSVPKEWLQWPARSEVASLIYEPGRPRIENGKFNSWKGWGCESVAGDASPWTELLDYIFSDDSTNRVWFEQWCAYPFQNPGAKLYTACLFWGPETGTGKSLLGITIGRIYGDNFTNVENADLFATFNEWAVNKQFVLGDEISGSDKRSEGDRLKNLITRPKVRINMKHLPTYEIRDCINYFLTSNHADGLFLEDKDRRMFIHRMPHEAKPHEYYIKFLDWLDNREGKEILFDYFLKMDLTGFQPGAPAPISLAKLEMIEHAKSDIGAFIQDLQANTDAVLEELQMRWGLSTAPDVVLNRHLLMVYDPNEKTRVTSRGIGRALAAASVKSLTVNRTAAFGTQRFYVLRNQEKWLNAKPNIVRDYIDSIFKPTPSNVLKVKF